LSSNWGYVAAGYGISAAVLAGYAVWLRQRMRRIRRTLAEDGDG
jgi:hypothetical protein